jgi:hypothetical protein
MSETPTTNSNVYELDNQRKMTAADYLHHYSESIEHDHIIHQQHLENASNINIFEDDATLGILEATSSDITDQAFSTEMGLTHLQKMSLATKGMEVPQQAQYLSSLGKTTVFIRKQHLQTQLVA